MHMKCGGPNIPAQPKTQPITSSILCPSGAVGKYQANGSCSHFAFFTCVSTTTRDSQTMQSSALRSTVLAIGLALGIPAALYAGVLCSLVIAPSLQVHVIYLHKFPLTWFKNLNVPEQFGFAHHQVTPFFISTPDDERLHAWHVLPLRLYEENHGALLSQTPHTGPVDNVEDTLNFKLLAGNPDARLVLYFHGTSGTVASGFRPASYRALYGSDPLNTHILALDYRGYGGSTGDPSEPGLITDALTVADWALNTAGIKPEQIVVFGQSLGSAVALALVHELAIRQPAVHFAGLVITASFFDMPHLTATYRIGGVIPVLSPVAKLTPPLFDFFASRLTSKWDNMQRIGELVMAAEKYDITLIHAEDDTDIPMEHSIRLFRHAVTVAEGGKGVDGDDAELLRKLEERKVSLGEGGHTTLWRTDKGDIRLEILKYGFHDTIMSYPVTSLAVNRAFRSVE